jgi:RNA polymerase sigma factor (sigma-70 family)
MANGQLTKVVRHLRRLLGAPGGSDLTDRQLLERFTADRDEEAFTTLVARHAPLVLGVCRRILDNEQDAEDAFQAAFLLLARKAGTVGWHESVGNWLYSAAYHLASRLRLQRARRRKHERGAATMQARNGSDPVDWQQLSQVLDDELERLPEKYRMPLLLCYLHGKTRDEAAEQLGWTLGEVKGRLERGRDLLRDRLARRGLALSAALLPSLLAHGELSAAPLALISSTVKAVAAGSVSPGVAALAQGVIQTMLWTRMKLWLLALVAVVALGSASGLALYPGTAAEALTPLLIDPPAAKAAMEPLVIGDESNGKTISVPVGRLIEVRLAGKRANTGWESGQVKGDAVKHLNSGAQPDPRPTRPGLQALPFGSEFLPEPGAADKAIGTYVFCYEAVKEGRAELHMSYISPGGPGVTARLRSALIAEFKVTIEVTVATGKPSEPVIKDGLSITVTPTKKAFAKGEPIEFTISARNITKEEKRLARVIVEGRWQKSAEPLGKFTVTTLPNGKPLLGLPPRGAGPAPGPKYQDLVVAGGATETFPLVIGVSWSVGWTFREDKQDGQKLEWPLPPGRYTMTWAHDGVETKPVEFEIADKRAGDAKASEPAEKDGLAVTLKLSKTIFAADEAPAFETVLENRSDKTFKLLIYSHEVDYPYSCASLSNKNSWRVQQRPTSAVPPPQIVTLEPGKSHNVPVMLHGPFVGNRGEGRPARLPPGKYSLAGTLVFKEWIEKNALPYWTGEITSNAVEFEIADKPTGDAREIDLKGYMAEGPKGHVSKPTNITSAEELAKAFVDKEWQDRIIKQVDFAKEQLLLFAWQGSSGDQLSFKVEVGKEMTVVFTYSPGVDQDLRPHFRLFAIPKNASWRVGAPAADGGLSISVTPARAKFAYTEPLLFTVVFANTSKEALNLLAPDHPQGWKLSFDKVDGDFGFWVEQGNLPAAKDSSQRLDPGKSLALLVQLSKVNFKLNRKAPPNKPDGIPGVLGSVLPGRYRVTFTKQFQAGEDKNTPWWTGEITGKPVEVEISAGTADGVVHFDKAKQPAGPLELEIAAPKPLRTLNDFQKRLDKSLTPLKAETVFGKPDGITGSGLLIYVYDLDDGTKIWLGFGGFHPIMYAHHLQKDGKRVTLPLK